MPTTRALPRTRLALATSILVSLGCLAPRDLRRDSAVTMPGRSETATAASGPSEEDAIQAVLATARATLGLVRDGGDDRWRLAGIHLSLIGPPPQEVGA